MSTYRELQKRKGYTVTAGLVGLCLLVCVLSCRQQGAGVGDNATGAQRALIEVSATTDRTSATVSEAIMYSLVGTYDPEVSISMPEVGASIAGLRIVDFGEEGPRPIDDRLQYRKWYELRADIAGAYIIPSMTVAYSDADGTGKELKTPQIFIEVTAGQSFGGEDNQTDIIDIKPLQRVERDLKPYILAGFVGLAVVLAVIGLLFYIDRRNKRASKAARPPHEVALEAFETLQKEKLVEKGGVREHYFRLSDIFRTYIENRFSIPAVEQTTQELLPAMEKIPGMDEQTRKQSTHFLTHSDLIKFAKYAPVTDEVDRSHAEVLEVINKTKKEEAEEGKNTGDRRREPED
ncbi:MAG: protein BatD [Deltaproteobacteria bacterium]|nr:protein BatD [Deltaproteobacteria bacterium]